MAHARASLFGALSRSSERTLADTLRTETAGGALLLLGAVLGLVWANSPWSGGYDEIRETVLGPAALHLDLTIAHWATDGLLAIFFFVVGLELKREIVGGELRRPATAIVPIVAAVGGMLVPAAIYLTINVAADGGATHGWAVPTATDIAFAVAILALVGRRLPTALRAFLLTLAVVDDLLAITIIAIFYSSDLQLGWLAAALAVVAVFGVAVHRRVTSTWLLIPLGVLAWAFMHASGIHATIAGVLLGLVVPAASRSDNEPSLAERLEHRWRPVSAGFAVPVFALFAAGVTLDGQALRDAVSDPVAQGVALGLVLGKPLGIVASTALVSRFTRASLDPGITWWDVVGVGTLAGIGFTVSLLIGELAFGAGSDSDEHIKAAIIIGSLVAALAGGALLAWRGRQHARAAATVAT